MLRLAANLSLLYTEHDFLDRFDAAAADGFLCVECQFPYEHNPTAIADRLRAHDLVQVLINAPAGDLLAGDRGLACLPWRQDEFHRGFLEQALPYAEALDCGMVHVMAGVAPPRIERAALMDCYEANLAWAAEQAAASGVQVLIEPLNLRDNPGYLLSRQDEAHDIVRRVGKPNLKVQMDLYHCQIVEGDIVEKLRRLLPTGKVGHLQIAGVPDRHEPDSGELNTAWLLELIDQLGWDGWVGCEYRPRGRTSDGLGWMRALRA